MSLQDDFLLHQESSSQPEKTFKKGLKAEPPLSISLNNQSLGRPHARQPESRCASPFNTPTR